MHFGITEMLPTDRVSLYKNAGLISKVSQDVASKPLKIAVLDNRTNATPPTPWNSCEYPHKPYIARKSHRPTFFAADSMG